MLRRGHDGRLQIESGRRDALLGLRRDVEPHHGDREEHGRRRRGELDRQQVLQQPVGALEVAGHRHARQPRTERLGLVARGDAVEVAERQRRRVEEVRVLEVREADVLHARALVARAGTCVRARATRCPVALKNPPFACELGISVSVRTYGALNGSGNALKLKPERVVDRVATVERAGREQRVRVLDVELARAGTDRSDRHRPARGRRSAAWTRPRGASRDARLRSCCRTRSRRRASAAPTKTRDRR